MTRPRDKRKAGLRVMFAKAQPMVTATGVKQDPMAKPKMRRRRCVGSSKHRSLATAPRLRG